MAVTVTVAGPGKVEPESRGRLGMGLEFLPWTLDTNQVFRFFSSFPNHVSSFPNQVSNEGLSQRKILQ